jgi:CRISPR-associated Csx11 family protein
MTAGVSTATTNHLQTLRNHRSLLLACEAIGWLHMTGKAHPDFLRKYGGQSNCYQPEGWVDDTSIDWNNRLDWWRNECKNKSLTLPMSLGDFCKQYAAGQSAKSLLGFLQAGHAMASGIEKQAYPEVSVKYLGQDVTHMWLTTAFGHPVRNLLADPPSILATDGWDGLIQDIGTLLEAMKGLGQSASASVENWANWRDAAVGPNGWLSRAYMSTLAETRIPNNDVTLWDQSYIAAALFKAAVAGGIFSQSMDWNNLKSQTRWRVLTVTFGTEHYEARAVRIGDWIGARQVIELFFDDVCRLVEVDTALGSCVYRDDCALAFTFPGLRDDNSTNGVSDALAEEVRREIEKELDRKAEAQNLETPPRCGLSGSTRSFIPMAHEIAKARATVEVPIYRIWSIPSPSQTSGHVCPVCQVRRSNKSNDKQQPCNVCKERRTGRLNRWIAGGGDTIWIDEVADENDRVALLTLSLDLSSWLDGSHVDSLRAQSIPEWSKHNPKAGTNVSSNPMHPFASVCRHIEMFVTNPITNKTGKLSDTLLESLNIGFAHETDLPTFYRKIVEDRTRAPEWNTLDDAQRAQWLTHQLFRKNAAPGRLHRFWRTTEQFFDELLAAFREEVSRHANPWRVRRLVLKPTASSGWKNNETYTGAWRNEPLELLYRNATQDFLTTCNLARLLKPEELLQPEKDTTVLKAQKIELTSDDGISLLTIDKTEEAADSLGTYRPLIVLEQSLGRFRVLVPLSVANACIERAVTKWTEEFARVWDRLPLRIGVVAFPRMTPYQAVIEAARNLEDDLAACANETWRVQDASTRDGVTALSLVRADGELQLVTAPALLPNGRKDLFYSYCRVEDGTYRDAHDFDAPSATGNGTAYRRMAALRQGDGILVSPSSIATVFLDSTARRFDPPAVRALSDWRRMREIWRLIQESAPSFTALRAADAALSDAWLRWSETDGTLCEANLHTWLDFVRALLVSEWGVSGMALDTLVDAARCGLLKDTLIWHLRVLKLEKENR